MNHGSYMSAKDKVVVTVSEAIQSNGSGKISYTSSEQGYAGYLDYSILQDAEFGQSLCIPSMNTDPNGKGLGTLLTWIAANTAIFRRCGYVVAVGVFGPAQTFYYKCGLSPSAEVVTAMAVKGKTENWNDEERQAMFSSILKWGGKTSAVLDTCYKQVKNLWVMVPPT